MARVELEVDRNVLELTTMLPDPPEVDRYFYADVWSPQEIRHGQILDVLQVRLGRDPAVADLRVPHGLEESAPLELVRELAQRLLRHADALGQVGDPHPPRSASG